MSARSEFWRERALGMAWLAGWRLTRLLPERAAVALFERFADRSYRTNERRRAVVRANLEPVVGAADLDRVVRAAFRSYGRYWAETFRMQDLTGAELNRRFSVDGVENIEAGIAAGTGAVLATLHIGNWDAGGRWVAAQWPLTAVAEVLRPRVLFDRFVAHRRSLGIGIVPLRRGGDATKQCLEKLDAGELVALVADRDLSGSGVEVRLFGRRTKMPPGPAVLSLRTGAPLLPACIYMEPEGHWRAVVMRRIDSGAGPDEPAAVAALTQRLADAFGELIARHPDQWHAFQPYWLP